MKKPFLLGHRGMRQKHLENTGAGFIYAHSLSALDGVEFDIQMTQDGQFVIFHDEDLKRLCHQQSYISDLSTNHLSQFKLFDGKTHHAIPNLREMPTHLTGFCHIELEIKTHQRTNHQTLITQLAQALDDRFQALPITLTTFDKTLIHRLQRSSLARQFDYGLLVEQPFDAYALIDFAQTTQCCQIGIYYPLIDEKLVHLCHQQGLKVCAWTVNDAKAIKHLAAIGVDIIISDKADEFL